MKSLELLKERLLLVFNNVTSLVLAVILLFLMIGILIGVVKMFLQLGLILESGKVTGSYLNLISDVLSLFILIELSRSLVDYFVLKRLRLTFIIDAGIVFVLREIMIQLFEHKLQPEEIYALSVLLLVLGILRIASIIVFPKALANETGPNRLSE